MWLRSLKKAGHEDGSEERAEGWARSGACRASQGLVESLSGADVPFQSLRYKLEQMKSCV